MISAELIGAIRNSSRTPLVRSRTSDIATSVTPRCWRISARTAGPKKATTPGVERRDVDRARSVVGRGDDLRAGSARAPGHRPRPRRPGPPRRPASMISRFTSVASNCTTNAAYAAWTGSTMLTSTSMTDCSPARKCSSASVGRDDHDLDLLVRQLLLGRRPVRGHLGDHAGRRPQCPRSPKGSAGGPVSGGATTTVRSGLR